jgi:hypothetical protein
MAAFTTIAAAAGLAATAGTTAASFAQAGKQRNLQAKAEAEAEKSMAEAKKQLSINYSAALGIQKEPYQLEREALISAGAQAIEAGREGERGAAETAGRVYALQQQGQQQIASEMGQELTALDKATAAEAAQLRNSRANLNLAEVQGAQTAAANAQEAAQAATMQGIKGIASTVQQAASFVPLYNKSQAAKAYGEVSSGYGTNLASGKTFQQALTEPSVIESVNKNFGIDLSTAPTDPIKFQDYITTNFNKDQIKSLNELVLGGIPQASKVGFTNIGALNTQPLFDMGMYGVGGRKY